MRERPQLHDAFGRPAPSSASRRDLVALGYDRAGIASSLETGALFHARRDVYLWPDATPSQRSAARVGGRVDCVSRLAELGVFVLKQDGLHVQVQPTGSRLRSARDRRTRLADRAGDDEVVHVHWRRSGAPAQGLVVPAVEALAQAFDCQGPRAMIASIDSALHAGAIREVDLDLVFRLAPRRFRRLRELVDRRAESGPETLARLIARAFGRRLEVQKQIAGVGRVDLVLDGWLVIECDSKEHHEGWAKQAADRRRDLLLAARGCTVIRPTAHMIFAEPELLIEAIRGLLATRS